MNQHIPLYAFCAFVFVVILLWQRGRIRDRVERDRIVERSNEHAVRQTELLERIATSLEKVVARLPIRETP
jgi:hypothetical protein